MKKFLPILFLLLALPVTAQNAIVTATITAPSGAAYANGSFSITLVDANGNDLSTTPVNVGGNYITIAPKAGALDGFGAFTAPVPLLENSAIISPTGTKYRFGISSAQCTTGPRSSFSGSFAITSSPVDLSSSLSALAPEPQGCGGGSGNVKGPNTATNGDAAIFSGNTGKAISDAGYPPAAVLVCTTVGALAPANNGCYNLSGSSVAAMPAANTFTIFRINTQNSVTATLTGVTLTSDAGCSNYISGGNLALPGNQSIVVQSDGTNVWATCTVNNGVISGQASGVIPLGTTANTIANQSHMDDGVTVAGDITSSESLLTKIGPVANILAYGADPTGVSDSAAAVRAARDAMIAQGGGTVYLGPGTWFMSTVDPIRSSYYIDVQANNIHFVCDPRALITNDSTKIATIFAFNGNPATPIQTATGYAFNANSSDGQMSITMTTAANANNFTVGDPIYIRGGPGGEAQPDGEINWVTSVNGSTGVVGLLYPTAKAYTGTGSVPGTIAVPGGGFFFSNLSVSGCQAFLKNADFSFIGQAIDVHEYNNNVVYDQTSTSRGMFANSFYPMANIYIQGNKGVGPGTQGSFEQIGEGWTNTYITDNIFSCMGCNSVINPSEGAVRTHINNNILSASFLTLPTGNFATVLMSTEYHFEMVGNTITFANSTATASNAVTTGLSNGQCHSCKFADNTIVSINSTSGCAADALNIQGGSTDINITGNNIESNCIGIASDTNATNVTIADNIIRLIGTGRWGIGDQSPSTNITGNQIHSDTLSNAGVELQTASLGGMISGNTFQNLSFGIQQNGNATFNAGYGLNSCIGVTTTTGCTAVVFGTPTFTPGTNVTSVACAASHICTNTIGTVTIVGGTATTGTIATINWSVTEGFVPVCTVRQNGGVAFLGIGSNVPTTAGLAITAGVTVSGQTVTVDYQCQ